MSKYTLVQHHPTKPHDRLGILYVTIINDDYQI